MKQRDLKIWKEQKKKIPDFIRSDSWKVKRLENSGWRKPKGLENKMRLKRKGWPPIVKIGYRKIRSVRGLHPSGLKEVLVYNEKELVGLDPENTIVRISSSVGKLKRIKIIDECNKLGIKVANPRI
jgi:large subunit ribosomal protein L32e